MKASELVEILERPITVLEKAQLIMDGFSAKAPSAFNIKPKTERKKPKMLAVTKWAIENGIPAPQPNGHLDLTPHEEATP